MDSVEFVSEKKDYSVPEFHDRFHKCLPKIVEVNQGVCSKTGEDTFGKGEIIVIGAISRQRRVVTKIQLHQKTRMLSIPETYDEKLCIVRQGRAGKEDLLINILGHNKLPIAVCFPRNRTITLGDKTISSDLIPHLELTESFDEVYLLGHYINNGELCKDVVPVPLYLSQLRVSVVNGLKGKPVDKWKQYKRNVNDQCHMIKYDREFGNPDIAEYDPSVVHSGKALSYLEPMTYENIVNLVHTSNPQSFFPDKTLEEIDELGLYEDVQLPNATGQRQELYYNQPENNQHFNKYLKKVGQQLPMASLTHRNILHETSPPDTSKQRGGTRPPIAPKPKFKQDSHLSSLTAPALPTRQNSSYQEAKRAAKGKSEHSYSTILPTSTVAPTVQTQKPQSTRRIARIPSSKVVRTDSALSRKTSSSKDVTELSVQEVCEYLKELNLSQYRDRFKGHMIDGAMLVDLEADFLIELIGMRRIEVIRLMKFAKEGHLPIRN